MSRTPEQVRQAGLEALCERLGRADMIRFLQQFDSGEGDYARDRQKWVDETTLEDIRKLANRKSKRRRGGK